MSGTRYAAAESRSRFLTQLADLSAATPGVELAAPAEQVPFLTHRPSFGRPAGGTDAIGLLKEQVWRLDPELPVTVHAMDDVVANALAQPRFLTTLLAALALLALLLAGAGLFAVVSYETSARTREIGVRVALGATRGGVIRHVLGRSLLQSAAGAAVGLLGAFALTRLLAVPLFGSEPTSPATFAVATAFLLLAAAGGAWLPARRAARTDPMAALRAE